MDGFYLGPLYIYTWGLTAAIGVIVAIWLASKKVISYQLSVISKITENKFWSLATILVVTVFMGARIAYILETWNYYAADPGAIFRLWEGGFSFLGGAIGAILAGYVWSRINNIDFLYLGWVFTPAWLFGMFFGRIGCSLIHDHLGKTTDLPWGIYVQGAYRHEPAMYEAAWLLLIGVGLWLWSKKSDQWAVGSGQLFPYSLLLYSAGRFAVDFLRADDDRLYSLTIAQWFCAIVIIWAVYIISEKQNPSRTTTKD